jgi:hypothetical protein
MGPVITQASMGSPITFRDETRRSHHWGMHLHNNDFREGSFEILTDLGVHYVRTDVLWSKLERITNLYDQDYITEITAILTELDSNGLEPLLVLTSAPSWAETLYKANINGFWVQVQEYHAKVAELWGTKTRYYQIENELNHPARPSYLDYVDIPDYTRYSRLGIVEYDNDFKLILNSNCEAVGWSVDMDRWLSDGANQYIDVIGLDIYPLTWDSPATLWSALRQTMTMVTNQGTSWHDKDIIVAETGFSTYTQVKNEEVQRSFIEVAIHHLNDLVIDFNKEHSPQVLIICWYELYDSQTGSIDIEKNFGICRSDSSKKTGYNALKTEIKRY